MNGVEIGSDTASGDFTGSSTTYLGRRSERTVDWYNDKIDETKVFTAV